MHLITNLSDIFLDSKFINGSIFQVLKLYNLLKAKQASFMMTQFFQVLKRICGSMETYGSFMMTQFFQVLKPAAAEVSEECFMMTQFFQVLKHITFEHDAATVL